MIIEARKTNHNVPGINSSLYKLTDHHTVYVMPQREELWGSDADKFNPERWKERQPGWEYLPFNGGSGICIGQQLALTEVAYVVIRLMQRIDDIDGVDIGPVSHGLSLTSSQTSANCYNVEALPKSSCMLWDGVTRGWQRYRVVNHTLSSLKYPKPYVAYYWWGNGGRADWRLG